jgi:hypothetical protein
MASIERTAYPRFKPSLTTNELQALYCPTDEERVLPATVCNVSFFPSTSSFFDLFPFQNDCERCGLVSKTALFALLPHPQPS